VTILYSAAYLSLVKLLWAIFLGEPLNPNMKFGEAFVATIFLSNVLTDYVALFLIRPSLARCGARPVFALILGSVGGMLVISVGAILRSFLLSWHELGWYIATDELTKLRMYPVLWTMQIEDSISAIAVFAWLPLFALGVLLIRAITPLSWIIAKTQWLLKGGQDHPLKAVAIVAAVAVFAIGVVVKTVFRT
jgi:hypothetical protein